MKHYVINLDRAHDRLMFMTAQFNRLSLSFVRVPAHDARAFTAEEKQHYAVIYPPDMNHHGGWSLPYIACFLSHLDAWRMIAAGEAEFGVVYEDDVHFSDRTLQALDIAADQIKVFDVIRLETTLQGMRLRSPVAHRDGISIVPVISGAWGAAAYMIRRDVASWLIAAPHRLHYSVDWMLFHRSSPVSRALRIGQCDPAPCVQDQYHPEPTMRVRFDNETNQAVQLSSQLIQSLRRIILPTARIMLRRRSVNFY